MEAYLYSCALCLATGLIWMVFHFLRFVNRHKELQCKIREIVESYDRLPPPETLAEQDYQEMISLLGRRCQELSTSFEASRQDSLDYYTTWVHQIKTPISVMELMLQSKDTTEYRALSAELFRIEQYVEMVLGYLRLDSDSSDLVFARHDLDTLIRQSIRKYAPSFVQKKLRLIYEPASIQILTDEKWFCFLLEQLLSNAVKYTWQGSVTISISPDRILTIRDTGIGIAPEDLPRIFEKGFTGYNGRAHKKSTGLGLYLCKQAANRLGIPLQTTSTPGEGSCFYLDLSSEKLEID
jgi:signal transduction histidine kinase